MNDAHFEPATLSDGSVLSARRVETGLEISRGAQVVVSSLDSPSGHFIVSANQRRAVLVSSSSFEVLELHDGLSLSTRGERLEGSKTHYALSADGAVLATLTMTGVDGEFAKLIVRSLEDEGRSTHSIRLNGEAPSEVGLSIAGDGAVTIAFPWAAHSIPMSPKPADVLTFDSPESKSVPGSGSKARFQSALAARGPIERLGDITLRYEPSMLIGETEKLKRSALPSLAWTAGFAFLLFALAALLLPEGAWLAAALLVLAALAIAAATRLERHEKRQRRFVANFLTYSLRLDFTSPIAGRPRTIVVPFDDVKDLQLVDAGTSKVLVVEFVHQNARLQEALVAFVPESQLAEAQRLQKVLHGAFGLGEVPADSPIHDFAEESSFD